MRSSTFVPAAVALLLLLAALPGCGSSAAAPDPTPPPTPTPEGAASLPDVDADEAAARLRVRLQPDSFVDAIDDLAAVPVADGLQASLVLQYPDGSRPVTTSDLTAWGLGIDAAMDTALDNTVLDGAPSHEVADVQGGGRILVFGEQVSASSWLLLLDELLADLDATGPATGPADDAPPGDPAPLGVVVSVPTRDGLDLHVVGAGSRPVLDLMAQVAYDTNLAGPAAVTDDLYWWHDGTLEPIQALDGRIRSLPPDLAAALDG